MNIKYSEINTMSDFYDRCCDEVRMLCPECAGSLCVMCEDGCQWCGADIDFNA